VRAILSLGSTLDIQIVAEGVETESQSSVLQREGVTAMQGFLFGVSLGADAMTQLLRAAQHRLGDIPDSAPR